jgi:hypothetical protein
MTPFLGGVVMRFFPSSLLAFALTCGFARGEESVEPNPLIDYAGFLENAAKVDKLRSERRLSEGAFIRMAKEPGTIVFDARSDSKYAMLHVKGARHLSLPDITAAELAKVIPDKSTKVLIYCNNNFKNEPKSMPGKQIAASLNIYTFNTLYAYGYTNVYELGPLIDIKKTRLTFEGSLINEGTVPSK